MSKKTIVKNVFQKEDESWALLEKILRWWCTTRCYSKRWKIK